VRLKKSTVYQRNGAIGPQENTHENQSYLTDKTTGGNYDDDFFLMTLERFVCYVEFSSNRYIPSYFIIVNSLSEIIFFMSCALSFALSR
jgi:hypothetical protein